MKKFTPPQSARNNARKVLEWRRKYGDDVKGMTRVGWARANQLASGRPLTLDTVKRMAQFNRHRGNAEVSPENKGTPWKDAGRVAWLGWGGSSGINWAKAVVDREENKREKSLLERARELVAEKQRYDYHSTQFDMPADIRRRVQLVQRVFDPEDLAGNGLETNPHITVLFGLDQGVTADQVAAVARDFAPFTIQFGEPEVFENPEFDVVVIPAESGKLRELNARLRDLPNQNSYRIYNPHMTIAYVKRGQGRKYLFNPVRGREVKVDSLTFSPADGDPVQIPLGGGVEESTKPGKKPGPSIKRPDVYEALRRQGMSKQRAAAISNSMATKEKEPKQSLSVFKQANGRYRWVTLSSNAFRDRDREIVSTKALANDVARADRDGDYGPLRFWHLYVPVRESDGDVIFKGADIGDCDFNWLRGRTLIESGTFRDEAVAQRVAEKADNYQVSIGFRHPKDEPDEHGVFHTIRRFERSLVPAGRTANPWTSLSIRRKSMNEAEKFRAFKALLEDDALVERVLAEAKTSEKAAEMAGVQFKDDGEVDLTTLNEDELLEYALARKEAAMAAEEEAAEKAKKMDDKEEEEEDEGGSNSATKMGNYVEKMGEYTRKMGGYCDRMEKMLGSKREKDDGADGTITAVQEATNAHSTRLKEIEETVAKLKEENEQLKSKLGDMPPAVKNTRATASDDNIVEDKVEVGKNYSREKGKNGAFDSFVDWTMQGMGG